MASSLQQAVASLETIEVDEPGAMRARVLEAAREVVACDALLFVKTVLHDGAYYYTAPVGLGDADVRATIHENDGTCAPVEPYWKPECPDPDERNRFVTMAYDPERLRDRDDELLREIYGAHHICAQARSLVYEGNRFLGYLALWRRRPTSFDDEAIRRLEGLQEAMKTVLAAAERVETSQLEVPADILFEPEGPSVEYASDAATEWLDADRFRSLADLVQRSDAPTPFPPPSSSKGSVAGSPASTEHSASATR